MLPMTVWRQSKIMVGRVYRMSVFYILITIPLLKEQNGLSLPQLPQVVEIMKHSLMN